MAATMALIIVTLLLVLMLELNTNASFSRTSSLQLNNVTNPSGTAIPSPVNNLPLQATSLVVSQTRAIAAAARSRQGENG